MLYYMLVSTQVKVKTLNVADLYIEHSILLSDNQHILPSIQICITVLSNR